MAYEEDIPKVLNVGETYTSEKIRNYISFNDEAIVLCDQISHFQSTAGINFRVSSRIETFVHKNENRSYHIPSSKKIIYYVDKI